MRGLKHIISAMALISCTLGIRAQITNLLFYSDDKEPFYLFINGVSQNQAAATSLRVTAVPNEPLQAFILFANPSYPAISNTLNFHAGTETMIGITKGIGGGYMMAWKGEIPVSAASRPGPGMTVVRFNATKPPQVGPGGALNMMGTTSGQGQSAHVHDAVTDPNNASGDDGAEDIFVLPGYRGPIGCNWPMTDDAFADARASIAAKSFEDSKLTLARQITGSHCLLTAQVKEIMGLFSFEDTRLKYAKYAYDHVYDRGNYYQVNDAFEYESSIDALNRVIGAK